MKKVETKLDELKPEYDLRSLRVRKLGPARKTFGGTAVHLEPDVAEVFPDAQAINEALRFLIRVARGNSCWPPWGQNQTLPATCIHLARLSRVGV